MAKSIERGLARNMRAETGMPIKEIARVLEVSQSSVSLWVRDIKITPEQMKANLYRANDERGRAWAELNRSKRKEFQDQGRCKAREGDFLHAAGCMLYWAEGAKDRNQLRLCNSDANLVRYFVQFLRKSLGVTDDRLSMRLNVYMNNGLSIREIESHWLGCLALPRSSLRKHMLDQYPTSTSGKRRRLPYGVCTVAVAKSTPEIQHIYGAIQEYGGFEEPKLLDGSPRRPH